MKIGIALNGVLKPHEFLQIAQIADELGVDTIWATEEYLYRSSILNAASILEETNRVQVISGPMTPFLSHPMFIAREILTLAEKFPDRVGLLMGVGDLKIMQDFKIDVKKTVETMANALKLVKTLVKGTPFENNESVFPELFNRDIGIPIYMAGMGPRMLALASQWADGSLISGLVSIKYIAESVQIIQNLQHGTDKNHDIAAVMIASTDENPRIAYENVRPIVAPWVANAAHFPAHLHDWEMCNIETNSSEIQKALSLGDYDLAFHLLPEKTIDTLAACGTPNVLQERICTLAQIGVNHIVIIPTGKIDNMVQTISSAVDISRRL